MDHIFFHVPSRNIGLHRLLRLISRKKNVDLIQNDEWRTSCWFTTTLTAAVHFCFTLFCHSKLNFRVTKYIMGYKYKCIYYIAYNSVMLHCTDCLKCSMHSLDEKYEKKTYRHLRRLPWWKRRSRDRERVIAPRNPPASVWREQIQAFSQSANRMLTNTIIIINIIFKEEQNAL